MRIKNVVLLLFVSLSLTAFGQTDLTGYWRYSVPNGGTSYMELKQTGETVSTVSSGGRGAALTGTLHDGKLHLEGTQGRPGSERKISYDAPAVKGNKFAIKGPNPNGEISEAIFERVTREDAHPARLPLPELRQLPDTGLVRTPPMGWNSWNHYHDHFDDAVVRQTADAIVASGMDKAGFKYVIIDEGWSSGRDANGKITGNARFPDMKALAAYIHSKGLKAGIYSSPGPQVCGGYTGSYGHEQEDANTFAEWGYDYLKYDWCSAGSIYSGPADLQGAYQKMGEALQKTGRPMVYSLCEYGSGDVWKWGGKTGGNLWRTTGDISDRWDSMERIGFAQLDITDYPKPGQWNDPDMLEVGNGGMTADEYRTHMTLWSLLRAPLIAGNDPRTMTDETRSILMNADVIAIDQDPDAKPATRVWAQGKSEVITRPLAMDSMAIALFNRGDQEAEISFRWDTLRLSQGLGGRSLQIQDLWKHEAVKVDGDTYTVKVPKHGVVLLKATSGSLRR